MVGGLGELHVDRPNGTNATQQSAKWMDIARPLLLALVIYYTSRQRMRKNDKSILGRCEDPQPQRFQLNFEVA